MSKSEQIEILSEIEVIAITMKDISYEMTKIPITKENISNMERTAKLINKLISDSESLVNLVLNMK